MADALVGGIHGVDALVLVGAALCAEDTELSHALLGVGAKGEGGGSGEDSELHFEDEGLAWPKVPEL